MSKKPTIPKGTRDFSPQEMLRRNYIFDTIKEVFRRYGFEQIETPSMENRETLTGKYGEEGDQLIYNILDSGNYLKRLNAGDCDILPLHQITTQISGKALRYDLTVPFARYVVQHQNEITFPFKRFQIQPVWRADRPQKGRYREFYQCDVDIVGSDSLLNEAELIKIFDDVFFNLGMLNIQIKLNNRKILSGIAEIAGHPDKITEITVAIDKLDKIGMDKVKEEWRSKGLGDESIEKMTEIFNLRGTNTEIIELLRTYLSGSEIGRKGIEEVEILFSYLRNYKYRNCDIQLDLTLARGLNYYTGAILEVVSKDVKIGSICGGGRYDDLTGIFGLPGISGVGVSFGADRIYDLMQELNLFPSHNTESTKVLFVNFGKDEEAYSILLLNKLREEGIPAEIYPEPAKLKKQMKYADQKNIPYTIVVGTEEKNSGKLTFKNMSSGEQERLDFSTIKSKLKNG